MVVINHGISHHDVYDDDGGGGGGAVSQDFQIPGNSKVVRYGLETGPIWPPKWAVINSWTTLKIVSQQSAQPFFQFLRTKICHKIRFPICCPRAPCTALGPIGPLAVQGAHGQH